MDSDLQAAMQASLKIEPLSLDKRHRSDGVPVGLKNVGNTCYFNSFIQAFFFMPNMSDKLLKGAISVRSPAPRKQDESSEEAQKKAKRVQLSNQMASEL